MKKIWIIVCLMAIATPFAEIAIEGFTNQGALWITAFLAGIGVLGMCLKNIMFPTVDKQYHSSW